MARDNLVRFDPFAEMQALQRQLLSDDWLTPFTGLQMPATDIYTEGDKQMTIEAHLPNFADKDVNINLDNDVLEIQASRHEEEKDKDKKYVVRESSSNFYRRIQLPERADKSKIVANMENGVLEIVIPFKKLPAPKKVSITSKSKTTKNKK